MSEPFEGSLGDFEADPIDDFERANERRRVQVIRKHLYLSWLISRPMCECGKRHIARGPKCFQCMCADGLLPIDALRIHQYGERK